MTSPKKKIPAIVSKDKIRRSYTPMKHRFVKLTTARLTNKKLPPYNRAVARLQNRLSESQAGLARVKGDKRLAGIAQSLVDRLTMELKDAVQSRKIVYEDAVDFALMYNDFGGNDYYNQHHPPPPPPPGGAGGGIMV